MVSLYVYDMRNGQRSPRDGETTAFSSLYMMGSIRARAREGNIFEVRGGGNQHFTAR